MALNVTIPFPYAASGFADAPRTGANFESIVGYLNNPSGGSGVVNVGAVGQLAYYATAGNKVSGFAFGTADQWLAMNHAGTALAWKTQYFANVKDYGATGDGITDDTAAIQAALTNSHIVYFPPHTSNYRITSTLLYHDGQLIFGAGNTRSTIVGNITAPIFASASPGGNINGLVIRDLGIDNTSHGNAGGIGIELEQGLHCKIDGVKITNVETGIKVIGDSFYNSIFTPTINGCITGIWIDEPSSGSSEVNIFGGHVNNVITGLRLERVTNVYGMSIEEFTTGISFPLGSTGQFGLFRLRMDSTLNPSTAISIDASFTGKILMDMAYITVITAGIVDNTADGVITQIDDDCSVAHTKKIYLDGRGDSYLVENTANQIDVYTNGAQRFAIGTALTTNLFDFAVTATKRIYLDGGTDTYLTEPSSNLINFVVGGNTRFFVGNALTGAGINATDKLYLDGGGDTYLTEPSANQMDFYTGGGQRLAIATGLITSLVDFAVTSSEKVYLDGGTDTYIVESSGNVMDFFTNATLGLRIDGSQNISVPVGSITIPKTTNQLVLSGPTRTATLSAVQPATSSRTYTFPDAGANANVAMDQGNYTIAGTWTFSNDVNVAATKKVFLDGGGDTYVIESSSNILDLVAGGTTILRNTSSDVYTTDYTDYSGTSTITGWSAFTTQLIYYKRIGKLVYVWFDLVGTSNSGTTRFTLPFTAANTVNVNGTNIRTQNNGSFVNSSLFQIVKNTAVVDFYVDSAGNSFTASGDKSVQGSFFYQTT